MPEISVIAIGPMSIRLLDDGYRVSISRGTGISLMIDGIIQTIKVPSRFTSDGASIPQCMWWLCGSPLTGKYRRAAIIHDAIYSQQFKVEFPNGIIETKRFNRKTADRIFYKAMIFDGCNRFRAYVKYLAVRAFGGAHFNKER